jgi:Phage tail lysozyme
MQQTVEQQALQYFRGKGLTPAQAAGIVGNLKQESSLNPNAPGGGLDQGQGARANSGTVKQQLDKIWSELSTSELGTLRHLQKTHTPAEAARVFSAEFERPGEPNLPARERYAEEAAGTAGHMTNASFLGIPLIPNPAGPLGEGAESLLKGGGIPNPLTAIKSTADLAIAIGEWVTDPLRVLKLVGGGILLGIGLKTLTRGSPVGPGGAVSAPIREAHQGTMKLARRASEAAVTAVAA